VSHPYDTRSSPPRENGDNGFKNHAKSYVDSHTVLSNFPFPTFYKYQKEKLLEIAEAFNSGYKWILLETPTGFGKSPLNVAFCRTMRSFYTTPQNILLDQLLGDFPDLALIKGRRHYDCVEHPYKCDDGPCQRDRDYLCHDKYERCPYWKAKIEAVNAQTALTNFAYFIGEGRIRSPMVPHLGDRELLVIDEGHNIDEHVLRHISISVTRRAVPDKVYYEIRPTLLELPKKLTSKQNDKLLNDTAHLCAAYLDRLPPKLSVGETREAKMASAFIQKVDDYWQSHDADWRGQTKKKVYSGGGTWVEVKIQPTYVQAFMREHLWNRADRFIISSATIFKDLFIKECGLTDYKDQVWHTVAPSTFPIENRMIVDASVGSLSWKKRTANMPAVVNTIRKILEVEKGKGIIHAHSYDFAEAIANGIPDPRLLFHESTTRDKSLKEFLDSPPEGGQVFVAVAMTEGLDLYGDLATFQILLKCPYANYVDDLRVGHRLKDLRHNRWYAVQTLKVIVQAYGRAVRSPTDKAAFYILDSDVNIICKRWRRQLPQFFAEAYNKREMFK